MDADAVMAARELQAEKLLLLQQTDVGLEAFAGVDNVACGPAVGGIRMPLTSV